MKAQTLDMKFIRYLNLFEKVTRVRTQNCFFYNKTLIFAVPKHLMSKAIGAGGKNVKKLVEILGKKVKIISLPSEDNNIEKFILEVIYPITFKSLEVSENEIVISASTQSKAALIGRNKVRLQELGNMIEEFFGKKLRIV